MSHGPAKSRAGDHRARRKTQPRVSWSASMSATMSHGKSTRAQETQRAARCCHRCARRSRPASYATRTAASSRKIGFPNSSPTRMSYLPLLAAFIIPTGRNSMRYIITDRSSRARCLQTALRRPPRAHAKLRFSALSGKRKGSRMDEAKAKSYLRSRGDAAETVRSIIEFSKVFPTGPRTNAKSVRRTPTL